MTQTDLETFITGLPKVQRIENLGYTCFFVGDDHRGKGSQRESLIMKK
jgi:hypothetical protein